MVNISHSSFEETIAAALVNCPPGLLAAVSGGADSTAMLVALAAVRDRGAAFQLRCIHVEHGIRPAVESRGDAGFVRSLCEKLNVPCRVISIPPGRIAGVAKDRGIGIEAAARLYRRRALFREARRLESENGGAPVQILTAHTADDMLETVLMRILRGSGPSGLAAMPAAKGRFLRPLITLSRRDVLGYLADKNIAWREDSTNADIHFLRNRIRHCLIPLLGEHFPHWRSALSSLAETQSLAADFIRDEASLRIKWKESPNSLQTDAGNFFAQALIIREEAIFQGIDALLPASSLSRGVKRKNIRRFSQGTINAADLGPFRIQRNSSNILLLPVFSRSPFHAPCESGFSLLIKAHGSYNLKGITVEVSRCSGDRIVNDNAFYALLPLVLRPCFNDHIERHGRRPAGLEFPADVAAVDPLGVAALIGSAGLLQRRDEAVPADGGNLVQVVISTNNGGTDV
ncbi:MAG: tRNA lysidine(34) synthetase TilS [Treponema sp.]|nr:tRNA lysidine(34) synthetase TilS [Treponema sp.]